MNPEELAMLQQQQPPELTIDQVIQAYMQNALDIQSQNLDVPVKAQAMLQMAQALNYLVPLATNNQQAELEMKAQEHQMNLQSKQAELAMKQQEHEMKLAHSQQENAMKLQQAQDHHANSLVQSQQSHATKLEQMKSVQSSKNTEK
jgi:hypothetical protein